MLTVNIVYALLSGILPSLLWLSFWLGENNLHPEPRSRLAVTFVAGMIAVLFALLFQWLSLSMLHDNVSRYTVWAFIEEFFKFGSALLVALRFSPSDEPIDAMIYMITAALGFAALENTMFIFGHFVHGNYVQALIDGNLRFIGATLVHTISSALIGFCLALVFYSRTSVRVVVGVVGLILATALHASFNLSIINTTPATTFITFAWFWAGAIVLMMLFEEIKALERRHDRATNSTYIINKSNGN